MNNVNQFKFTIIDFIFTFDVDYLSPFGESK